MVGVFLAEGFEEIEALTVVDLMRRAQIDVKLISITGNVCVTSNHSLTVKADLLIEDVDFAQVEMIVLPGGLPGATNLEEHETLMNQVKEFNVKKKYLAAICAAPQILGHLHILEGKTACCYPGVETELFGANVKTDSVCVDEYIVTSRGMGTAMEFGLALITILKGAKIAQNISEKIIFNDKV